MTAVSSAFSVPAPPPPAQVVTYPLRFTGKTNEFFRIWIVNVALTVVTLGIYAPWARVRTRQYFYGNTWLDGHNFEYSANPVALLRGYLIVGAFALASALARQFPVRGSEWVVGLIGVLFVAVYPWLVRQSMRFLARSTVHRGLSFHFEGSLGGAYTAYGLANIAAGLTGALALPWAWFMQRRYQVAGLGYGTAQGRFRGELGGFYLIGLVGLGLTVGGGILLFLLALGVAAAGGGLGGLADRGWDAPSLGMMLGLGGAYLGALLLYGLAGQYLRAATMRYVLENVELGGVVRLRATFSPWQMVWISLSNYVAQLLSLGLLTPWAAIRRNKYLLEHLSIRAIASLDDFSAQASRNESALGEAATELLDIHLGF